MNRRSFLESILIACAAPAIVRADSLMRIVPRELTVLSSTVIATAWDSVILPGFTGTVNGSVYLNGHAAFLYSPEERQWHAMTS